MLNVVFTYVGTSVPVCANLQQKIRMYVNGLPQICIQTTVRMLHFSICSSPMREWIKSPVLLL